MTRMLFTMLLLLTVFGLSSYPQNKTEPVSVTEKEYRELKDEYSKLIEKQLSLEKEWRDIIKTLHDERKDFQEDIKYMYGWALGIIGFIGTCFIAVLVFFGVNSFKSIIEKISESVTEKVEKGVTEKVEKAVSIKIGEVVANKTELLESQMKSLDKVATYKDRKKILILSDTPSAINFKEKLSKIGFKCLFDGNFNDYFHVQEGNVQIKPEIKRFDIVFINGINVKSITTDEELFCEKIIFSLGQIPVFFFNNRFPQNEFYLTAGSATLPSQVYGNLINLIEFTSSWTK